MSGRRFPNACTTAPFSTFWLRVRTWKTYGTARPSPSIGCSWPLVECSQLLRDVVRELHPDVLARLGLKAALTALTDSLTSRTELTIELDARTWPDGLRTDADYVLYSAARETLTNVIKHARAHRVWIDLERHDGLGSLRVADDGVGITEGVMAQRAQEGHIGLSSMLAKALAAGGQCDVRATSPGTEITISIPLQTPRGQHGDGRYGVALTGT